MQTVPHPDAEQLTAYVLGKLSWTDVEKVETHLSNCDACRSQVGTLDSRTDSFVACLRGSTTGAEDPALDLLLANARAVTPVTLDRGDATPPKLVAGLELLPEQFVGGLGIVCKALHPVLKAFRAIKRPQTRDGAAQRLMLARFLREVEAVGSLHHDHIIRAHDAGSDDDGPYLVMEWLDGEPLNRLLARYGPLPVPEACELVRQAALGLQAAHERGLVHRDIKPSNLMLARANIGLARVVVIDWGLVKRAGTADPPSTGLTDTGTAMGTPDFIAPEQIRDASGVDIRADVYSLGATLHCLLAGRAPFHDRSMLGKLTAHAEEPFPPLGQLRSAVSPELLEVLNKMVAKDPARRIRTPGEAADALKPFCCPESRLLRLLEPSAGTTITLPPRPVPVRRSVVGWLVAAVTGVLLLACLGSVGVGLAVKNALGTAKKVDEGDTAPVSMSGLPGYCSSLVFMPDGSQAVSESGGAGVDIWDLENHRLQHSWLYGLQQPFPDAGGVVAVSPDGNLLAAASLLPGIVDKSMNLLSLYDQQNFAWLHEDFGFSQLGRAVVFSPDSSRLAIVELGDALHLVPVTIEVIDIKTRKAKRMPTKAVIGSLAFSADGKFLVCGGSDRVIRLWEWEKERQVREFTGHTGPVSQVVFGADGKRVYSASSADRSLRVWDNDSKADKIEKETRKIELAKDEAKMTCVALGPGGRALTGHLDGSAVLWDLETGKELYRHRLKDVEVTAVALSPDGRRGLAAGSDRNVYLYRLPAPKP